VKKSLQERRAADAALHRRLRAENPEKFREKDRLRYAANPEKFRARMRAAYPKHRKRDRAYREAHRERINAVSRIWESKHREKRRAKSRAWYAQNREKARAYRRHYSKTQREKCRESQRRCYAKKPDVYRALSDRRRAAKFGLRGNFRQEWSSLQEKHGNRCVCCGREGSLTPDHIVQIKNIGKGLLPEPVCGGNAIGNIQPLCFSCNSSRNDRIGPYVCICGRKFKHKIGVRRITPPKSNHTLESRNHQSKRY